MVSCTGSIGAICPHLGNATCLTARSSFVTVAPERVFGLRTTTMHARQLIARQLIDDAPFGPNAVKAIGQAFDEVWGEFAGKFGAHLVAIEAARLKLADALLSIASEETRDVEVLKCFASRAMARHYREALAERPSK
jgi:hypothetical protein